MSVYVPKVGDRVRRATWQPGKFITVTAVGKARLLAAADDLEEWAFILDGWEPAAEPLPEKPEWLDDRWMNVYPATSIAVAVTAAEADDRAFPSRIGRVCLGTGEWVPCRGKEVLS